MEKLEVLNKDVLLASIITMSEKKIMFSLGQDDNLLSRSFTV